MTAFIDNVVCGYQYINMVFYWTVNIMPATSSSRSTVATNRRWKEDPVFSRINREKMIRSRFVYPKKERKKGSRGNDVRYDVYVIHSERET
ncbi:hypothetical protein TNCT_65361 [Trichonephila clavata]|uniref:Uncharacterized protein n=1 Tax=Trichonephila clavata TaxID=2740835 RepID=A0A8X6I4W4_TRICU|nr:hypothetical protein TNCT_65361 [Trichonephila clavata]